MASPKLVLGLSLIYQMLETIIGRDLIVSDDIGAFQVRLGGYSWKANESPHIKMIAGGAGITPIYQLPQGILRNPDDKIAITLVFGVNSDRDVLLQKELEDFSQQFPGRFKAIYTISNPGSESPFHKGYVSKKLLEEVLPKDRQSTMVFVCGPPAMEESLVGKKGLPGVLTELRFGKNQIHKF